MDKFELAAVRADLQADVVGEERVQRGDSGIIRALCEVRSRLDTEY